MRRRATAAALAVSCALLAVPAAAPAADAVYWTNSEGQPISFSNLDGSGAGNLALSGVISSFPAGLALDPADGKVFFTNVGTEGIFWAYLDGSGGGQINTAPVSLGEPVGIAVDRAAGRVYWSDHVQDRIGYASLDGGGGAILNTAGATIDEPNRLALDPAAGRLYWANFKLGLPKVSYANLNGTGGDDISKSLVPNNGTGVALDPRSGRVFWSVLNGTIESSALDGSGTAKLNLLGATPPEAMRSIAIDLETNRAFWTEEQVKSKISFANLSGGGGGDMSTAGANLKSPSSVAILRGPAAASLPSISGPLRAGSTLTCSQGGWAADAPASLFYRAPQRFAFQWLKGGSPIAGSTQPTLTPANSGTYSCAVTATNFAGSASQTSAAVSIARRNALAARVALVKGGRALLKLRCPAGTTSCAGKLRLEDARLRKRRRTVTGKISLGIRFGEKSFSVPSGAKRVVKVKLNDAAKSLLRRSPGHKTKAQLAGGGVESRTVVLKLAKKPKRR